MQITNLYGDFFEKSRREQGYREERECWEDLFACLDMMIVAEEWKKKNKEREPRETFPGKEVAAALRQAEQHIRERLSHTDGRDRFRYLCLIKRLHLTAWECFLLLVAFSVSFDGKYETAFAFLHGAGKRKLPTLWLAASLYRLAGRLEEEELARAVQKRGMLFSCFLETSRAAEQHPLSFSLSLNGRACAFLYGNDEPGEELAGLARLWRCTDVLEPVWIRQEKQERIFSYMARLLQHSAGSGHVVQIYGEEGIGKRFLLCAAAKEQGTNLLFINTARLFMATAAELRLLCRRIRLECLLAEAVVCFEGYRPPRETEDMNTGKPLPQELSLLLEEIRENHRLAFWLSEEKADFLQRYRLHVLYLELPMLTIGERLRLWQEYGRSVPVGGTVDLERCANQFTLTARGIREVLWDAGLHAESDGREMTWEDIREAVSRQRSHQLGGLARQVPSVFTWEDLVVGEEQRELLLRLCHQVRYRSLVGEEWGFYRKALYGTGVSALFYGPPGTGKTMAAQVVANELGLTLYRIDISQMVSKYIGETEKNISELFERAGHTNAILFFDEADSLFARRSEVRDAHDRNANRETAHLLQKIEDYDGVCILATNLIGNLDEAFKRRIRFMIPFVFPTPEVRLQLWRTILPGELPLEEEPDFAFFAEEFELAGSGIREILTNAAFLAAAERRGLRNRDLVEAVRMHFAKYGRALTEEDFGYLV